MEKFKIPYSKIIDKTNIIGKEIANGTESRVYEDKRNINNVIKSSWDLKEYNILKNIKHDNIISPIDWFVDKQEFSKVFYDIGRGYYGNGILIENLLTYYVIYPRLEKITEIPSVSQIKELENSIKYLIDNNIVHNDIYIDNIMKFNQKLCLIDFGNYENILNAYDKDELYNKSILDLCKTIIYYIIESDSSFKYEEHDNIYHNWKLNKFSNLGELGQYIFHLMNFIKSD